MTKNRFSKPDIFILIFCVLFALANICSVGKIGRENEKRAVCASNIKQQLKALMNFSGDNEGNLPATGGYWPCDIDYKNMNNLIEAVGISISDMNLPPNADIPVQDVFYCPSNISQKKARVEYWRFAISPSTHSGYRIMGYFYLWAAAWNINGKAAIKGPGNKKWVSSIFTVNPSETEMVIDAVMSDSSGNFGQIKCGGSPGLGFFDSSSHLKIFKQPYGSNIGFVDGHVEWRPFNQMYDRYGYTCPRFWW